MVTTWPPKKNLNNERVEENTYLFHTFVFHFTLADVLVLYCFHFIPNNYQSSQLVIFEGNNSQSHNKITLVGLLIWYLLSKQPKRVLIPSNDFKQK